MFLAKLMGCPPILGMLNLFFALAPPGTPRVPRTWYWVPTWHLVPGTGHLLGTWYLAPVLTWCLAPGTWHLPGTRYQALTCYLGTSRTLPGRTAWWGPQPRAEPGGWGKGNQAQAAHQEDMPVDSPRTVNCPLSVDQNSGCEHTPVGSSTRGVLWGDGGRTSAGFCREWAPDQEQNG